MNDKDRLESVSFLLPIDAELKRQFEQFCNEVGISMTATFALFAKKVVREHCILLKIQRLLQKEGEKGE